jgi:transketolase
VGEKYRSFGFACFSVNGHDVGEIVAAINTPVEGKPKFIDCRTHKGYGVSFMQDEVSWHGKAPNEEQYNKAIKELEETV